MLEGSSASTSVSLISRVRHEDSRAWRELVDLYTPLIAEWCRKKGLGTAAIQDCIQEVFFAVLKSLNNYRSDGSAGSFRSWLWTITRNKIVDAIRRDQHHPQGYGGSEALQRIQNVAGADDMDSEPTEAVQLNQLLHRGLAQVREQFQTKTWQAFWRTTIDGIPIPCVAEELDLSPTAVRQYRSRVLRRLREQLGDMI